MDEESGESTQEEEMIGEAQEEVKMPHGANVPFPLPIVLLRQLGASGDFILSLTWLGQNSKVVQ